MNKQAKTEMAEGSPPFNIPTTILIVGSGAFGLSTALALSKRPQYARSKIILLDRLPFPAPDSSSIDTSRIIRADYASAAYASLATQAQELWRGEWGAEGRYCESGLVLTADQENVDYVRASLGNVRGLARDAQDRGGVEELKTAEDIEKEVGTGGCSGTWGYINRRSGWADAEAAMRYARKKVEEHGKVEFRTGEVQRLLRKGNNIEGVEMIGGGIISANLVILATGAWTAKLIDLRGRAEATGQVLAYMDLTQQEQERLAKIPVLLNFSTGLFVIPPKERILKIARHAYGYSNPTRIPHPERAGTWIDVSLPSTQVDEPRQWIPREGEEACRRAVRDMVPSLGDRPFTSARVCWYTDTPEGNFIITYHPGYNGLFLAIGGSGHGFKFLPVIGEKILDAVEGNTPDEFRTEWAWPEKTVDVVVTNDGSRGGRPGMVLDVEMGKGSRL
ncbi:MAG: hypothetical protein M1812_004794 [Candelaria pacifica]|nr:MAG: hypothetical protein M1812_004794 [Candelaria pacifica]